MIKNIKLTELEVNSGQIEGLPKNPRFIKDDRFKKLVKSIEDDPEMLALRELIVFPNGKKYVIICGNMRYRALQQIGYKDAPCKVLPVETPVEKLQAYAIKDNVPFGSDDWELLANEWDEAKLGEWGLELPNQGDIKIYEDDEINESCNFIIQCQNIAELEELKIKIKCNTNKINYDTFIKLL